MFLLRLHLVQIEKFCSFPVALYISLDGDGTHIPSIRSGAMCLSILLLLALSKFVSHSLMDLHTLAEIDYNWL